MQHIGNGFHSRWRKDLFTSLQEKQKKTVTHTKLGIANIAILKEVSNDIISLSRQEQVCLVRVRFKRYFLEKLPHSKYLFMTI